MQNYDKVPKVWHNMMQRCYNPNYIGWHNYGGRGIGVCRAWRDKMTGMMAFIQWNASLPKDRQWQPGLELDRWPDTNGDYSPSNCRWATHQENHRNRRNTLECQVDGKTMLFIELWESGHHPSVTYKCAQMRYTTMKWDAVASCNKPKKFLHVTDLWKKQHHSTVTNARAITRVTRDGWDPVDACMIPAGRRRT